MVRRSRLDCIRDWDALAKRGGYHVSALARECGVTERQLRRFFWVRFGQSPRGWFAERRLGRAAGMLQQPVLVKEAADEAGYKSAAHFTRSFKLQYGVPPSAFRSGPGA